MDLKSSINILFTQFSFKQLLSGGRLCLHSLFNLWVFMLRRNNRVSDLLICAALRFNYLGMLKGEVLVAAILQLTEVHTHICFATTHVVARHAAAVVSCISNVQSFTELTALTLNKSNNNSWDYGFSLP